MIHRRNTSRIVNIIIALATTIAAVVWIIPFIWMLSTSFKENMDIFKYPVEWIPVKHTMDNFKEVWMGRHAFNVFYVNSLFVTAVTVVGGVMISSLAAYGFARLEFPGRDIIFMFFLATMMIPTQVTLIPRFVLFNQIGLINSHWSLILPSLFNVLCTFLMRQFYVQIPIALSEAAYIDGAGELRIWFQVIMPLTKPAMVTVIILLFTTAWNDYENPLIFLTNQKLFTIPLGLNNFIDEYGTQYGPMMAAAVSSLIPMIVIFIAGQKYFIEGVATSGIKG